MCGPGLPPKRPFGCMPGLIIQRGDESVGQASNPLDGSLSLQGDCRLEILRVGGSEYSVGTLKLRKMKRAAAPFSFSDADSYGFFAQATQ